MDARDAATQGPSLPLLRVALVTDELPGVGASGGMGAAIHELACLLADSGAEVWLYYACAPDALPDTSRESATAAYRLAGVRFRHVDPTRWTHNRDLPGLSYAVYRELSAPDAPGFDWVHFPDYHGLGFYFLGACEQGLVQPRPRTVLQLHGSTRWATEANNALFSHEDHVIADWMERRCVDLADHLVSPSRYLADHVSERHPDRRCAEVRVIKNPFRLGGGSGRVVGDGTELTEVVFFGRHEPRKGLVDFCDAIDRVHDLLAARSGSVTFLGSFGTVNDEFSGLYLLDRASRWDLPVRILPGLTRTDASFYLDGADRALVVVPSPRENSPYTVVEALASGRFVLTSSEGGAHELLAPYCEDRFTCAPGGTSLAAALRDLLTSPALDEALAQSPADVRQEWLDFHAAPPQEPVDERAVEERAVEDLPLVTVVITHHERPAHLLEAVESIARQDYPNLEILVVDDGSSRPSTVEQLAAMGRYFDRVGARLIRQENRYLGAARNRGLAEARGEFVLFLDDDDLALPTLVSTLVGAQRACGADVLVPLNMYLPLAQRGDHAHAPGTWSRPVSYLPLGGPRSLAPVMNLFGPATGLMRRSSLESVGGYSELRGVGFEDLELYLALSASGADIGVVPEPLYLYEVDRPSMISTTSTMRNHKRVLDRAASDGIVDEFLDLIAVVAGRTAAEVGRNRLHYLYRLRGALPEELELLTVPVPPEVALERLGVIAAQRGHARLERDLALSAQEVERVRQRHPARDDSRGGPRATSAREVLAALGSIELRIQVAEVLRTDLSEPSLLDLAKALQAASDETVDVLWVRTLPWARMREASPDAAARLMVTARNFLDQRSGSGALEGAHLHTAQGASAWMADHEPPATDTATTGLRAMLALDIDDYSRDHPDVARAISSGDFDDPLRHYIAHGFAEGRPGFARTRTYLSLSMAAPSAAAMHESLARLSDAGGGLR